GGKALGGDFERRSSTRAVLEKEVEDRLAAQQRHLLDVAFGDRHERHGSVENAVDYLRRQVLEREQMLQLAGGVELWITHPSCSPRPGPTDRACHRDGAAARSTGRGRPQGERRRRSPRS